MGTRSKLFASAAFPLLSLALMLQPANAAVRSGQPTTVSDTALDRAGAYEVAQEQAPDGGQDDQDPRKHKKHGAEGQPGEPQQQEQKEQKKEPAGEPKPPAAEPPKAEAPKEEAPKAEPPKAAPAPEPKAEQPKPAPAAQPEAAPEPPKPHKQEAEQPKAAPAPKAAVEQPAAPAAQPDAQPEPPKKKAKQAEEPAAEQQATPAPSAPKPAGEPAAAQQQDGQPPKKHQKPAEKPAEAAQPAEPAAPPAAAKTEEAKPAAKPAGEQQPAAAEEKPAPKAPVEGKAAQPADQTAPTAEKPAAAKPVEAGKGQPPAPANAPADAAKAPPAGAASPAVAEQPAPAGEQVSPAEIERRKKIAENPAAATGPVILPVQNGAAVLDSDKDAARRGHRQGGNGQPGQGGQRPAGQAQGGQMQGGQAPAGQVPAGQAPAGQAQGQGQGGQRPPENANAKPPTSDADAQRGQGGRQAPPVKIEAVTSEQGRRMDQRPNFAPPDGAEVEGRQDNRVILNFGDDVFVRHDDTQRFTRDGERPSYEQLSRDRYRETIARPDGTRIVTVRNRYGDIIQRSSIDPRGREYVLFYAPELEDQPDRDYYRDPGDDLPPMRLRIPLNQYIIDTSNDRNQDYYDFLREPPVEQVERVYSLNEVRYSARIRDKVRRIDLDTITFATGSADIPMTQAKTLRGIADAIGKIIKKDPSETFLIEGHTDAVGSAQSNLVLSDQRAESVANLLTDVYGIPPENLATQGYGEQYLKVNTSGPEQENRRVTIRRVTALVRPVASRQ